MSAEQGNMAGWRGGLLRAHPEGGTEPECWPGLLEEVTLKRTLKLE